MIFIPVKYLGLERNQAKMQMNKASTQSKTKYRRIAVITNSKQQAQFWSMFTFLGQKVANTISLGTCAFIYFGYNP